MSDQDAITFIDTFDFSQNAFYSRVASQPHAVWRVSDDTVLKPCYRSIHELYTMIVIGSQTTIPVAKVRKAVFYLGAIWLFLEYIDGQDLDYLWDSMWWWQKLRIAWELRHYVQQIRRINVSQVPGPLHPRGEPQLCEGHLSGRRGAGPFSNFATFYAWYACRIRVKLALEKRQARENGESQNWVSPSIPFDYSQPFVLNHGDIALHNIRIGRDGTIWLLDWGFSGVYPQWFEYAAAMAYADGRAPRSWLWLVPFIVGSYPAQKDFTRRIGLALEECLEVPLDYEPEESEESHTIRNQ